MESNVVAVKEHAAGITGNTIGERLKSARKRMKYSQELVASASDINISNITLGRYERNERMVPEKLLYEFAALYCCDISDLATEEDLLQIRKYYENPHVLGGIVSRQDRGNKGKKRKKKKNAETQPAQEAAAENNNTEAASAMGVPTPAPAVTDASAECVARDEVRELAKKIKESRTEKGISAERLAEAVGIPLDAYDSFENGDGDITISQLSAVCKELRIGLADTVKEVFRNGWFAFYSESPKDIYAALGVCVDHGIEHYADTSEALIRMYGDRERIETIFNNLQIHGRF